MVGHSVNNKNNNYNENENDEGYNRDFGEEGIILQYVSLAMTPSVYSYNNNNLKNSQTQASYLVAAVVNKL